MDFIVGLPMTACMFDSFWVIVDRLSKSTHFIPAHTHYDAHRYAEIYIACVLCLYEVPKTIISDRGSQFVTLFWEQLHASLGTHLIRISAYHPQTDGQIEEVPVFRNILEAGIRIYPRLNFLTTIVTKKV
jgi:hypothetical protein